MARDSRLKRASSLGVFLLVSVLAGLLVAGMAIPAAAVIGVSSSVVSSSLTELPQELETPPLPTPSRILLADGSLLVELYDEYRKIVPLEQIAPIMQQAQVAIEDDRFFEHGALDLKSLIKAVTQYFVSTDGGGGSTLTQQYVKQVLIETAATDPTLSLEERQAAVDAAQARTPARKISEMRMAIALEERLSKNEILNNYLNIAYYGSGAYGVEAAAHRYFNTSAANLSLAQAAMLAGIVQTPSRNPIDDLEAAFERRTIVLDRMVELNIITEDEAEAAKAEGYDPAWVQTPKNGCANIEDGAYIQVCQYIVNVLKKNENLGGSEAEAEANLKLGGYTVQTTIDPVKQHAAQNAILGRVGAGDPVKSVMVMMQPGTGHIWAAAQNRMGIATDDMSNYDNLMNGKTNYQYFAPFGYNPGEGSQAGSTFKPFVAAAALAAGLSPNTTFNARSRMIFPITDDFKACNGAPARPSSPWSVSNASPSGVMNMYRGTAQSVNTYYVQLERAVGMCATVTMARDVGVVTDPNDESKPDVMAYQFIPAFVLGTAYTTPMHMAVAYSTFAARGVRCDPVVVLSIKDRDGNDVPTPNGNCQQVINPDVADAVNLVTNQVFRGGTATGWGVDDGRPASGKTGTTEEGHDVWLIGYTPEIVGVAMVGVDGNPDLAGFWGPQGNNLTGVTLPSGQRLGGLGSTDAAPIWYNAMNIAVQGLPATDFVAPSGTILKGKAVYPPDTSGMDGVTAKKTLEDAGFTTKDEQVFDAAPAGSFLGVSSCQQFVGGECTLLYSKGPREPVPPPTPQATPNAGLDTGQ